MLNQSQYESHFKDVFLSDKYQGFMEMVFEGASIALDEGAYELQYAIEDAGGRSERDRRGATDMIEDLIPLAEDKYPNLVPMVEALRSMMIRLR
jgi:hypothetical protein